MNELYSNYLKNIRNNNLYSYFCHLNSMSEVITKLNMIFNIEDGKLKIN